MAGNEGKSYQHEHVNRSTVHTRDMCKRLQAIKSNLKQVDVSSSSLLYSKVQSPQAYEAYAQCCHRFR